MPKAMQKSDNFPTERPAYIPDSQRGSENVGIDDIQIPRIDVLQDLSPQRKKNDPTYIEGAEEGLLFNTISTQLYGTEVYFVPVVFKKQFIIWKDRDSGGGFRGAFDTREEAVAMIDGLEDALQCEVVDTNQHFGLLYDPVSGGTEEIVVSCSRSKLKASRQLNTLIRMNGGDSFSRAYKLSAVQAKGAKGEYYNIDFRNAGFVPESVFYQAEAMYGSVMGGNVSVDHSDAV